MDKSLIEHAIESGKGVLRLAPTWVPRSFCVPGRRIKLHPNDYYALGGIRGGIDERWLSSTTVADNGPLTEPFEGLSFGVYQDRSHTERFLLRDAVDVLKGDLIGERTWNESGRWPIYSKFFDNKGPLPFHIHHRDEHAALVGESGKPEAYYFPPQLNNHGGAFPYTFFGLQPGVTKDMVKTALMGFKNGDNRITELSLAYKLQPGTGWDVPPGLLHAPGSLCTYEPQVASDVFAMYESVVNDAVIDDELLWKNSPPEKMGDFEYLVEVIDWDLNVKPDFSTRHFMMPRPVRDTEEMHREGYEENWICYKSPHFSAKELTVFPGTTVTIRDSAAYGMCVVQGHGLFGQWDIETPALIRFGSLTSDEYFVSEIAATEGIEIKNRSLSDPIVILKHFSGGNPDLVDVVHEDSVDG